MFKCFVWSLSLPLSDSLSFCVFFPVRLFLLPFSVLLYALCATTRRISGLPGSVTRWFLANFFED